MKPIALAFAALLAAGLSHVCLAQQFPAQGYPTVPLLSARQTVTGEDLAYPASGRAVVTASILTLAPGERTIAHRHGVPLFAYILEGELTVDYEGRGKKVYRQGDAFMEAMQVDHWGQNTGAAPVRILAVYMGADGARDVIPK